MAKIKSICFFGISILFQLAGCPVSNAQSNESPYVFIENKGQWGKEVQYAADIPGGRMFVSPTGIHYAFIKHEGYHAHHHDQGAAHRVDKPNEPEFATVQVEFLQANPKARVTAEEITETHYNYYLGNDESTWADGCRAYGLLTYHDLYPGIDLKFYSHGENLKYDLIVRPNADPSQIKFRYTGQDSVWLSGGSMVADARISAVIENEPFAYHQAQGSNLRVKIDCQFRLEGNVLSFEFPQSYTPDQTLVIDPELIFSTFSGSISDNFGYTACFDQAGNLYSGGIVFGSLFPATTPRNFGGGISDMAIQKYDSSGRRLLYATFLGGSSGDTPHSMVVNNQNELVIMGTTGSTDYPTSFSAYDRTYNGGRRFGIFELFEVGTDIVLSKLGPTGNLIASTFVGGPGNDGVLKMNFIDDYVNGLIQNYGDYQRGDVFVDANDNIYVASSTDSTGFPTTGGLQPSYAGGNSDAVVFSLNSSLSTLRFSTYLGGSGDDAAYSIKLDAAGNILVGGGTMSTNFPTTNGTVRSTFGGMIDGFITKINPTGNAILQSTFLGTNREDQVYFIDIDASNNVYAAGQTRGNYPVTAGTYRNANSGQFIHKLTPNLNSTVFSTVFGSGTLVPNISITAFLANECGNIFLSGWGGIVNNFNSSNTGNTFGMAVTPDAYRTQSDGSDFYLMALSADGTMLLYATFFGATNNGGDHVDGGTSRFDKRGIMYQSVCSCGGLADNFPTTPGAYSRLNFGRLPTGQQRCNNAAFKFDLATLKARFETSLPDNSQKGVDGGCTPFTIKLTNTSAGGESNTWTLGDGTVYQNRDTVVHTFTTPGKYQVSLRVVDEKTCQVQDIMVKEINVFGKDLTISNDITICEGQPAQLVASGGTTYTWSPAESLSNANISNPIARPAQTTTYTVTATTARGCTEQAQVKVTVLPLLVAQYETNTPDNTQPGINSGCLPLTISFKNTSRGGSTRVFDMGDGNTVANTDNFNYTFDKPGVFQVKLTIRDSGRCTEEESITKQITVFADGITLGPDVTICERESTTLLVQGGISFQWQPATSLSNPNIASPVATPAVSTTYKVTVGTTNGCVRQDSVRVTVLPLLIASFATNTPENNSPGKSDGCAPLTLKFTNTSQGGRTFDWDMGDGAQASGVQEVTHTFLEPGAYTVKLRVTDAGRCTAEEFFTTTITVYGENVTVGPDATICDGDVANIFASGGASYLWQPTTGLSNPQSANPMASPSITTNYTVRITTINGCVYDSAVLVTVIPNIIEEFSFERIEKCLDPPVYLFTNNTQNAPSSIWNLGDGTVSEARTTQHTYALDGTYTVSLNTAGDCVIDKQEVIEYQAFIIPNAFSPNGDGINDFFEVRTERGAMLRVVDRAGREVYYSSSYGNDWDGGELAVGTYFYTLTFDDGETCQGWVKLLR